MNREKNGIAHVSPNPMCAKEKSMRKDRKIYSGSFVQAP
jgi:hypothetical protein